MKRLTGEKLLTKVEYLRDSLAESILLATGYMSRFGSIKDEGEHRDFFREFYWAYVDKYGFPEKVEGEEYYAKSPDNISPADYILPPGLFLVPGCKNFEHALQTGHITFEKRNGPIKIEKYKRKISVYPRLRGEELLNKLEQVRGSRPEEILNVTGYPKFDLRGRKTIRGEWEDFCREFYWAYVDKYGFPKKVDAEQFYVKTSVSVSPNDYILPPSLVQHTKEYRSFETALQTGLISFDERNGPITIIRYKDQFSRKAAKEAFSANPNPTLEGESLLQLIYSLPQHHPVSEIAYRSGHKSVKSFSF